MFQLVFISIKNGILIKVKGFCLLNKLGGIIYESSGSFIDLMMKSLILLWVMGNRNG